MLFLLQFIHFFQLLSQLFSFPPIIIVVTIWTCLFMVWWCLSSAVLAKVIGSELSFVKFISSIALHLLQIGEFLWLTNTSFHFTKHPLSSHWNPYLHSKSPKLSSQQYCQFEMILLALPFICSSSFLQTLFSLKAP